MSNECLLCKPGTEGEGGTMEPCGEIATVCPLHYGTVVLRLDSALAEVRRLREAMKEHAERIGYYYRVGDDKGDLRSIVKDFEDAVTDSSGGGK